MKTDILLPDEAENRWRMRERNVVGWFQMAGIAEEKVLAAMLARAYKRTKKGV